MNPISENENKQDGYVPEINLDPVSDPPQESELPPAVAPEASDPLQESPAEDDIPLEEEPEIIPSVLPVMDAEAYFAPADPAPIDIAAMAMEPRREGKFRKIWRERKIFIILSTLFLLLAIGCISLISYVYLVIKPYEEYDYILPNVYCAGVDLSGMTRKEAQEAIEEALRNPSYTVTVNLPDASYEFCPQQEGVTLNGAVIAQKAYEYMRTDTSAYGIYKAYHAAKQTEYRLDAETDLIFSTDDIASLAETIYEETYVAPTESTASNDTEAHTVSLTLGDPGHEVDTEAIIEAVTAAFEDMVFDDLSFDYQPVEIDLVAVWDLANQCEDDYSYDPVDPTYNANTETHAIELTMGTPGYSITANDLYVLAKGNVTSGEYGTVTLDMTETVPVDVDITPTYKELACDPKEPYYANGSVQEGSNGYSLDWEAAISTILDAAWGEFLSIPMIETAPKRTAAELRAVLFRDELGSYSSPHTAIANRTNNLKLACQAINGTVINAGETFSFNGVVGERTAAKGYKEATVYVGTSSVGELGGGICQVASTIYNAALYADMDITTRAPHIYYVTYVKGGLDATVYWGSQDFCFRNNTEYPIRVNASVSGGYVHISIDGTKTNDNYVVLKSTQLSSTPYNVIIEYDSSKPASYSEETTSPYTGYVYEAYQYVYSGNGTLLESNYLGKSTYQKRDQVITKGKQATSSASSSGSSGGSSTTPETTPDVGEAVTPAE